MNIAEKLSGAAFEAALKAQVRHDSSFTPTKCENTMKRILADLSLSRKEVAADPVAYIALRNRICEVSESL